MMRHDSSGVGALLTINTGSSSVKIAAYQNDPALLPRFRLNVERIGQSGSVLNVTEPGEPMRADQPIHAEGHGAAIREALDYIDRTFTLRIDAIGHRVVHGGTAHASPERVTETLL